MKRLFLICLLITGFSSPLLAESFFVEGIQAPVWIEKNGVRQVLETDTVLASQDLVITGDTGKVWLEMADGAIVKLGNNAKMRVKSISVQKDPATAEKNLQAGLDIVEGAFRYTTSKLEKHLSWQRSVDIKLATTAAIGIRGTDLWGKVSSDNQFVVLLEGNINITPNEAGAAPVVLDQPLQIFKTENGQAQPVSTVDMEAVKSLAPETELDFGAGVQQQDGNYQANLASTQDLQAGERLVSELRNRGYAVSSTEVEVKGAYWTRIVLDKAVSEDDARSLADALRDNVDVVSPWFQRNQTYQE